MASKDISTPFDARDHTHSTNSALKEIGRLLLKLLRGSRPTLVYQTISGLPALSEMQKRLQPTTPPIRDPIFLARARRYMKFASGTFGWSLLQAFYGDASSASKLKQWVTGLKHAVTDDDINIKLLVEFTGVPREDWLVTQWNSKDLLRPAHCIGIDRRVGAVVFAVRGTMSVSDTITDLAATPGPLMDGYGHRGIVDSARFLAKEYTPLLRRTFADNPDLTRLIVTGHSLGAGTACVLALLLHTGALPEHVWLDCKFPVEAFAYAPPPVLSPGLAARCHAFVHSFVFRDDIVPRLSLSALYDLRDRAANAALSQHSAVASALPSPVAKVLTGAHNLMLRLLGAKPVEQRPSLADAHDAVAPPPPPPPAKPQGPTVLGEYGVRLPVAAAGGAEPPPMTDAEADAAAESALMQALSIDSSRRHGSPDGAPLLPDPPLAPAAVAASSTADSADPFAAVPASPASVAHSASAGVAAAAAATAAATNVADTGAAPPILLTQSDAELWDAHPDEAPPMQVPGRVYFIQQNLSLEDFVAIYPVAAAQVWRIVLGDTMFADHMPGMYELALDRLFSRHVQIPLQPWQPAQLSTPLSPLTAADDEPTIRAKAGVTEPAMAPVDVLKAAGLA